MSQLDEETVPFCVEPGWESSWFVPNYGGPCYRLLFWSDTKVGFEHKCDRGERGVIICAPLLADHQITHVPCTQFNGLHTVPTVTPSILCPDCGTHGFITAGRWVPC